MSLLLLLSLVRCFIHVFAVSVNQSPSNVF